MMPGGYKEAEYTELCGGLERMAGLYKNKDKGRSDGASRSVNKVGRLIRFIRKKGICEAVRYFRVYQSGVDRQLPVTDAGRDAPDGERNYFCNERIAVYMAEFGGYDEVLEPVLKPDNIDYFIISDSKPDKVSGWKWIDPAECVPEAYRDNPLLSNRWCKTHPHALFPEYRYSVYIDSNILVVSDFTELVNRMGAFPAAMFRHKNRECVYDEIEACILKNKAPRDALLAQRALLKEHGVPEKYGLLEAPVIVRKHMETVCIELMEQWWQAFQQGSGRDQIALIDALWKSRIEPSRLGTLGPNLYLCDLFILMPHRGAGRKTR